MTTATTDWVRDPSTISPAFIGLAELGFPREAVDEIIHLGEVGYVCESEREGAIAELDKISKLYGNASLVARESAEREIIPNLEPWNLQILFTSAMANAALAVMFFLQGIQNAAIDTYGNNMLTNVFFTLQQRLPTAYTNEWYASKNPGEQMEILFPRKAQEAFLGRMRME